MPPLLYRHLLLVCGTPIFVTAAVSFKFGENSTLMMNTHTEVADARFERLRYLI